MRRRAVVAMPAGLALMVGLLATPVAAAGRGVGCPTWGNPGGNSGTRDGQLMTVEDAVTWTMAQLTDAWYAAVGTTEEQTRTDRLALAGGEDKNGDGLVCITQLWGTELNPNAHWALFWGDLLDPREATAFTVTDNHRGTAKS